MNKAPVIKFFNTPIPSEIMAGYHGGGKSEFEEIFKAMREIPEGGHLEIQLSNLNECRRTQSNVSGHRDAVKKNLGFSVITRTHPVNGNRDGEWILYIQKNPNM